MKIKKICSVVTYYDTEERKEEKAFLIGRVSNREAKERFGAVIDISAEIRELDIPDAVAENYIVKEKI